jgi:hypothetical protein
LVFKLLHPRPSLAVSSLLTSTVLQFILHLAPSRQFWIPFEIIIGILLSIAIFAVYKSMPMDDVCENMRRLLATQEYPPIPERAQDIEGNRPWSRKSEREIQWGSEPEGRSWSAALIFIPLIVEY